MTPKFTARAVSIRGYYQRFPLIDDLGRKFYPQRFSSEVKVGDRCFLGKRVNNHHGELALWELWEYVVTEEVYLTHSNKKYRHPKTWFGKGRYLFIIGN